MPVLVKKMHHFGRFRVLDNAYKVYCLRFSGVHRAGAKIQATFVESIEDQIKLLQNREDVAVLRPTEKRMRAVLLYHTEDCVNKSHAFATLLRLLSTRTQKNKKIYR